MVVNDDDIETCRLSCTLHPCDHDRCNTKRMLTPDAPGPTMEVAAQASELTLRASSSTWKLSPGPQQLALAQTGSSLRPSRADGCWTRHRPACAGARRHLEAAATAEGGQIMTQGILTAANLSKSSEPKPWHLGSW